jgi:hypothetical protein
MVQDTIMAQSIAAQPSHAQQNAEAGISPSNGC